MSGKRSFGSAMSAKQIATSVMEGRQVTFRFTSNSLEPVRGYVCGMDDFHWMVVSSAAPGICHKTLVHKASAAQIYLHSESTYDGEQHNREDLDAVVLPFRGWVERTFFGRPSPGQSASIERQSA